MLFKKETAINKSPQNFSALKYYKCVLWSYHSVMQVVMKTLLLEKIQ